MSEMSVTRWDVAVDGPVTEENMKKKLNANGVSNFKRYEFAAGKTFAEHAHGEHKIDAITSGQFECTQGGVTQVLNPGDWLDMPPNASHSARVVGADTVVLFDATK